MTLRAKMLASVGLVLAVMIAVLIAVASLRVRGEFERLERVETRATQERLHHAVSERIDELESNALDLGARSSAYRLLRGENPDFVKTNLTEDLLTKMGVSFVVFLDTDGRVASSRFMDLDLQSAAPVDVPTVRAIERASSLQKPGDAHGEASGVLAAGGRVALVAAHAITTPDMYTVPVGTVVVGRYLDAGGVDELSEDLALPVVLGGGDFPLELTATAPPATASSVADPGHLGVWLSLPDLLGGPRIVLETVEPRDVWWQGAGTVGYLGIALLVLGAATVGSVLLLLDRGVLARLSRLSTELAGIAQRRDASFRVWEAGSDELSAVARQVNETLSALEEAYEEIQSQREELEERVEERTSELSESERRYRRLVDGMADGVVSIDGTGTITFANPRFEELAGVGGSGTYGRSLYELLTPASASEVRRLVDEMDGGYLWTAEADLVVAETPLPVELHASAIVEDDGVPTGVQLIVHDVSARQRQQSQLAHLASHDYLTGLHNRRFFEAATDLELAEVRRGGEGGAILWLDIDDFKDVNDALGHAVGDELLVAVAEQLRKQVRESNVLARIGGDEFAILLPQSDAQTAETAAARILASVNAVTYTCGEHHIRLSASMGMVLFPRHGTTVSELLASADLAMYDAKSRGRSRLHVYQPDDRREIDTRTRMLWNERITDALRDGRFVLHAQPMLDTRTDTIARYELLIRMEDGEGGLLAPMEFLPSAERLGLVSDIDRWVVNRAVELLAAHESGDWAVEVNLSGNAMGDERLLREIERLVSTSGIDPSRLGFEITETAAIADISRAREFIGRLSEIGCRFSLDDFGSGFSSFYYLKYLPIDCLKVDGSFIRSLAQSKQDQHLVRGIVELCRALGIAVAAEYVESSEVMCVVRDLEIDYAQGFYVGRPAPLTDAMASARLRSAEVPPA